MADTLYATTISNCASGRASETQFWNMRKESSQKYSGYWFSEHDIQDYIRVENNGSVLVSYFIS